MLATRRRRAFMGAVLVLAGGLVLVLVWSVYAGLKARGDLVLVREVAIGVRAEPPADAAGLRTALAPAVDAAARARDRLTAPGPALGARLPVLGRTLAAEQDAALAADALLAAGDAVLRDVERVPVRGGVDLAVLERISLRLERAAAELRGPVRRLAATEPVLVPQAVRDSVRAAAAALDGMDEVVGDGAAATRAAAGLLGADGPRTVLVVLMNNAELRGAGGYGGSFAVLRADRGRISVGPFQDVNEVQEPVEDVRPVPAPAEFRSRWGRYLADTTLWKNGLMSADQPTSASVVCSVARLAPGVPCDGVVLLDVRALASLVELTGPLDLGGGDEVKGDELVEALLVEAYAEAAGADVAAEQAERRRRLRAAADGAVSGLLERGLSSPDAARTLVQAGRGRHLAVWSAREPEQAALREAGLAGAVDPGAADVNLVSVNQLSASKLDHYVTRSVGLLAVVGPEEARVTQKVTLRLDTPPGLPRYVQGVRGGALEELMDIAVPLTAQDVEVRLRGDLLPVPLVRESGSARLPLQVVLGDGTAGTWEVTYRLPIENGRYHLELLPQPLSRDAVLHLAVVPAPGHRLSGGDVRYDGPYDVSRTVDVRVSGRGR